MHLIKYLNKFARFKLIKYIILQGGQQLMIHECKVFCHSAESDLMSLLGKEDLGVGKWLPFAFDITLVDAVKMTTDDSESVLYKCTTVFLQSGDTYIIDTPYREFINAWKQSDGFSFEDGADDDLEL